MPKDELKALLQAARHSEPVPEFDATWQQARSMGARQGAGRVSWRLVLVPVAAAAVLVLGLTLSLAPESAPTAVETAPVGPRQPTVATRDMPRLPGAYDEQGLGSEWDLDWPGEDSEETADTGESVVAYSENRPGNSLYESETDFLLEIEIPAWNGDDTSPL